MLYDSIEIESIKLALSGIESLGISSRQVLVNSIVCLKENYEKSCDIRFLEKSVWHIYAYLELGFLYSCEEKMFNEILGYLKRDRNEIFLERMFEKKVPLKRSTVRRLLGKWNPKLHSMKIEDAVTDIIEKVSKREIGNYTYYSGKIINKNEEKILWENTFRLYIQEDEIIFYNVNKNKYFVFEEESYDKNSSR